MNFKKKPDGILFDLDGTLWDATGSILESWNSILVKHPEVSRGPITHTELSACMGLPMDAIAARLLAGVAKEEQKALMDEMCAAENAYLKRHGGVLYEGLKSVLAALIKICPLYIVSNCQDGYIECFLAAHRLTPYFADTECWGRTGLAKDQNNRLVMARNGLQNVVYVGDTAADAESAKKAGIPFIFAAYGFGSVEPEAYVLKLNDIRELPAKLARLSEKKIDRAML